MTTYDDGLAHIKVTKVAGPGVPGLENDIPLYHFDVEMEDMRQLIADPDDFVARLGLRPDTTRQYPKMNLLRGGFAFDATDGGAPDGGAPTTLPEGGLPDGGTPPHSCCYTTEEAMICHMHTSGH